MIKSELIASLAAENPHLTQKDRMHVSKHGRPARTLWQIETPFRQSTLLRVFPKTGRITVEGINIVKRHRKARRPEEQSGIFDMPAPIHASNVMLLDPKSGAPTRTKRRIDTDGTKERISAKSGDAIPAPAR